MTITSTYDHRVIQGAESGAFLQHIGELLLGEHDFYRKLFADLGVPYQPYRIIPDSTPQLGSSVDDEMEMTRKRAAVLRSEEHTSELQSRGQLVCRLLL